MSLPFCSLCTNRFILFSFALHARKDRYEKKPSFRTVRSILCLFRASVVMIPKTPPLFSKQAMEKKRRMRKEVEMQDTMNDIRRFEKRVLQHTDFDDDEGFDENSPGYERFIRTTLDDVRYLENR